MELLRSFSRWTLIALAGVVVIVCALSAKMELGPLKYDSDSSTLSRVGLLIVGGLLLVTGVVLEILSRRRSGDTEASLTQDAAQPEAASQSEFLKTLDEVPGFEALISGASRVSVLGRTAVNLLTSYERALREACTAGVEVRLIFVAPKSDAARHLYGNQPDVYKTNLATAEQQIARLRAAIGPRLTVRTTTEVPPFSLVQVEAKGKPNLIRVQLNFMHSRIGRDRPVFVVEESDTWYPAFRDEFEATWHAADPLDEDPQIAKEFSE